MWAQIPSFERYECSTDGKVRNIDTKLELRPKMVNGYRQVAMYDTHGKAYRRQVSRLVLETFVGQPPSSDHTADHVNRDSLDDRLDNLRWATRAEQSQNRGSFVRKPSRIAVMCDGVEYDSIHSAASALNVDKSTVYYWLNLRKDPSGRTWRAVEQLDLPGEIWKPVKNRDGADYEDDPKVDVSQHGRLRHRRKHVRIRSASDYVSKDYYPRVRVRGQLRLLHEVVKTTFHGPTPSGYVIDHIDHDPKNAALDNLQFITQSENVLRAYRAGRIKRSRNV